MASSKASGLAIVAIVLLAFGLAGTQAIGLHKECTDGIDNDNDFDPMFPPEYAADAYDNECAEYPWADGNGETATPQSEQFNSIGVAYQISGYDTAFDWFLNQKLTTPHPGLPGMPPTEPFCPMGGTATYAGGYSTFSAMVGFDDWPTVEGSENALLDHWNNFCPLF